MEKSHSELTAQITIRLDEEKYKHLRLMSSENGVSLREVTEWVIAEYFAVLDKISIAGEYIDRNREQIECFSIAREALARLVDFVFPDEVSYATYRAWLDKNDEICMRNPETTFDFKWGEPPRPI